jgi:hypothetical protein
MRGST